MKKIFDSTIKIFGSPVKHTFHKIGNDFHTVIYYLKFKDQVYTLYLNVSLTTDQIFGNMAKGIFNIIQIESETNFCAPKWLGILAESDEELTREVEFHIINWESTPEYILGKMVESISN